MASNQEVISVLQQAIAMLGGSANNAESFGYPEVFDVKAMGYCRIGGVERARDELINKGNSGDKLAARFAELLPKYWFVQDIEDYVRTYSTQQNELQEFCCGNFRFGTALMGMAAGGDGRGRSMLWRVWGPAVIRELNPATNRYEDKPIMEDSEQVFAVANDSRTLSGKTLTTNPRVADMYDVVMSAFNYFYERNKNAVNPLSLFYPS